MTNRFLSALLMHCCLFISATCMADNLTEIKQKGAVRVAVYKDYPPYSYTEAGTLKGVDVDIARALAHKLGVSINYMVLTAGENVNDDLRNAIWKGHYLGGGTADIMLNVPYDLEFAKKNDRALFIAPYSREQIVIAYHQKTIPNLKTFEDWLQFRQYKIGIEIDSISSFFLTSEFEGQLTNSVEHYINFYNAFPHLNSGRLAAVMGLHAQIEHGLRQRENSDIVIQPALMGTFKQQWDIGMAVKAGNEELADAVTAAVKQLQAENAFTLIFAEYGINYLAPQAQTESGEK